MSAEQRHIYHRGVPSNRVAAYSGMQYIPAHTAQPHYVAHCRGNALTLIHVTVT